MKLERLLEIIIYLLNHEKVSATYLAEHFDVSVRTIQRDMASIAEAGIPVYALGGRYGGYAVLENYKIKNITFDYRNAEGKKSHICAEPLAIHYKWYAWYLFAYLKETNEYRTFKVARIQNLAVSKETSGIKHGDIRQRMKEAELAYYKTCIDIEIVFSETEIPLIEEYFPDSIIEKLPSRKCKTHIHVPAKERLWKALLLSFGNAVTVVSPKDYKEELIKTAQSFLANYDI